MRQERFKANAHPSKKKLSKTHKNLDFVRFLLRRTFYVMIFVLKVLLAAATSRVFAGRAGFGAYGRYV